MATMTMPLLQQQQDVDLGFESPSEFAARIGMKEEMSAWPWLQTWHDVRSCLQHHTVESFSQNSVVSAGASVSLYKAFAHHPLGGNVGAATGSVHGTTRTSPTATPRYPLCLPIVAWKNATFAAFTGYFGRFFASGTDQLHQD